MRRLAYGEYSPHYGCTIGCDFASILSTEEDGNQIKMQLWDVAGQQLYRDLGITASFYRGAKVVLLCAHSVDSLRRAKLFWHEDCVAKSGVPGPECALVLTKCDVGEREELRSAAKQFSLPVFEVSAKTGDGCDSLLTAIFDLGVRRERAKQRQLAAQQAAETVREMYRLNRKCFGVALPRDVLEYCIVDAIMRSANDRAWDCIHEPVKPAVNEKPKEGLLSSLVGWMWRRLGVAS